MRRGAYGFDAPHVLATFASLAATMFWRQGSNRPATWAVAFSAFFLANTASFLCLRRCVEDACASNIERRRLGWRFWWGNLFAATALLSARKGSA